jgi:hypothetical protein
MIHRNGNIVGVDRDSVAFAITVLFNQRPEGEGRYDITKLWAGQSTLRNKALVGTELRSEFVQAFRLSPGAEIVGQHETV